MSLLVVTVWVVAVQRYAALPSSVVEDAGFGAKHLLTWDAAGTDCLVTLLHSCFLFVLPSSSGPSGVAPAIVQLDCKLPAPVQRTVIDGKLVDETNPDGTTLCRLLLNDILVCAVGSSHLSDTPAPNTPLAVCGTDSG